MIGVYNYTVVLTYLSLLSASSGIMVSLWGKGHPFIGIFFLLLCGLFDAFDGKVARRTGSARRSPSIPSATAVFSRRSRFSAVSHAVTLSSTATLRRRTARSPSGGVMPERHSFSSSAVCGSEQVRHIPRSGTLRSQTPLSLSVS